MEIQISMENALSRVKNKLHYIPNDESLAIADDDLYVHVIYRFERIIYDYINI